MAEGVITPGQLFTMITGLAEPLKEADTQRQAAQLGALLSSGDYDAAAQRAFAMGDIKTGMLLQAQKEARLSRAQTMQELAELNGGGGSTVAPAAVGGGANQPASQMAPRLPVPPALTPQGWHSGSRRMAMPADPALGQEIVKQAQAAGYDPVDLATAMSYETGGTFTTGTTPNGRIGLIQFGKPEARQYGAAPNQTAAEQVAASIRYLQDRGLKPGMGFADLYSTINAGRPGLYNRSDEANGGAPGSVLDKVRSRQMAEHRTKAQALLGPLLSDGGPTTTGSAPPAVERVSRANIPGEQKIAYLERMRMRQGLDENTIKYIDNRIAYERELLKPTTEQRNYTASRADPAFQEWLNRDKGGQFGTSLQGRGLDHLVDEGILTSTQAAQVAAGQTVTFPDGSTVFMTPQGLVGQMPGRAPVPLSGPPAAATPAPAAGTAAPAQPAPGASVTAPGGISQEGVPAGGTRISPPGKDRAQDAEAKLRGEFDKTMKEFQEVHNSFGRLVATAQERTTNPSAVSPASDIALVFSYMKMLDPGSVVREGEFATARNAAGIPDVVRNLYNKALNGEFLTPGQRQDMVSTAGRIYGQTRKQAEEQAGRFRGLAGQYGLDPNRIVQLPEPVAIPAIVPPGMPPPGAAPGGARPTHYWTPDRGTQRVPSR